MTLAFALGGDEVRWLYLPVDEGRAAWPLLIDPDLPAALLELEATSASGELGHPGEVPFPAVTTLAALLADVEAELGPDATVGRLSLRLPLGLVFTASREREVRLEAPSDAVLAPPLARFWGWREERVRQLLAAARVELLTGVLLVLTDAGEGVEAVAYADRRAYLRGDPGERCHLAIDG